MPPTDHARPVVPFLVATGAIMVFTTMDAVVKAVPAGLPVMQVAAMRFALGIPLVLLAIVDYLALPYAAAVGFVFFGEVSALAVWLGAGLIVLACLIVMRRG